MQESWRKDPDKLTFIACLPLPPYEDFKTTTTIISLSAGQYDAPARMLGDINLFITSLVEEEHDCAAAAANGVGSPSIIVGEIELMIAVKDLQGKGFGRAALLAFLRYVVDHEESVLEEYLPGLLLVSDGMEALGRRFEYLRVRIHEGNQRSLRLFGSMGFRRVGDGEANYFGEVEMRVGGGERTGNGLREVLGEMLEDNQSTKLAGYRELRYGVGLEED
ncbi:MAG: hypothetical protein MMC33_007171 [Icmadophila ericetorum]|nr:hypothetical protein [Icmadophila ericetorum]